MKKYGVFAIEGEWETDLRDPSSIQTLVQFVANSDHHSLLSPIYRRVGTKESFLYYLKQWEKYPEYTVGYFCFHGEKKKLNLGAEQLTLTELKEELTGKCKGKHILLSCCNTLAVTPAELDDFLRVTKARSVAGYQKAPDWVEGSALDLMFMSNLFYFDRPKKVEDWLRKHCGVLLKKYGFVIKYRTRARS
jgi:hypothetical protein